MRVSSAMKSSARLNSAREITKRHGRVWTMAREREKYRGNMGDDKNDPHSHFLDATKRLKK